MRKFIIIVSPSPNIAARDIQEKLEQLHTNGIRVIPNQEARRYLLKVSVACDVEDAQRDAVSIIQKMAPASEVRMEAYLD